MTRRSLPAKTILDRRFPSVVALPDLPAGYGRRLDEMQQWCAQRCAAEAWAIYGSRFYFANPAIAAEFRETFAHKEV